MIIELGRVGYLAANKWPHPVPVISLAHRHGEGFVWLNGEHGVLICHDPAICDTCHASSIVHAYIYCRAFARSSALLPPWPVRCLLDINIEIFSINTWRIRKTSVVCDSGLTCFPDHLFFFCGGIIDILLFCQLSLRAPESLPNYLHFYLFQLDLVYSWRSISCFIGSSVQ